MIMEQKDITMNGLDWNFINAIMPNTESMLMNG